MKRLPVLTLIILAFFTATAFRYIEILYDSPAYSSIKELYQKRALALKCTPVYMPGTGDPIPALTGWGNYNWKVHTVSDSAQFFFNQGINMYYAFHIIESRASFDRSTSFDPKCAIAWWGKALAFGPNINDDVYQAPVEAYAAVIKARENIEYASPLEKELINAITVRYSNDTAKDQKQLNSMYKSEMKKVFDRNAYNPDITALYADALMLLHPWDLYHKNSLPKTWTPEIVSVIKHGLSISPLHPGMNHYYIHALEASSHPEDAIKNADLLSTMMPDVAHITHMPSHIYIRSGNYAKGIASNNNAIQGFQKYAQLFSPTSDNAGLYLIHNLHMKVSCAQMAGNFHDAMEGSKELTNSIPAEFLSMGGAMGNYIQFVYHSDLMTYLRFGRWDSIIKMPVNDSLSYTPVLQHFARGIAFARTQQQKMAAAELQSMEKAMQEKSLKLIVTNFNSAYAASVVAENILKGVIAEEQNKLAEAAQYFTKAVKAEDNLIYNEPRDWVLPARHYLGACLVKSKRYAEAEKIFRKDLRINPKNGWSIIGLRKIYETQHSKAKLNVTVKSFNDAWIASDSKIDASVY